MFKVSNGNTRTICEDCSKLTTKTPEQHQSRRSGVFIVNFDRLHTLFWRFHCWLGQVDTDWDKVCLTYKLWMSYSLKRNSEEDINRDNYSHMSYLVTCERSSLKIDNWPCVSRNLTFVFVECSAAKCNITKKTFLWRFFFHKLLAVRVFFFHGNQETTFIRISTELVFAFMLVCLRFFYKFPPIKVFLFHITKKRAEVFIRSRTLWILIHIRDHCQISPNI